MGLDNFAVSINHLDKTVTEAPDKTFAGIRLIGGLCSGGTGSASFRGKCYNNLVLSVTGQSLYQERIAPEIVVYMADKLEKEFEKRMGMPPKEFPASNFDWEDEASQLCELAKWFRVCADNGWAVHGWW